MTLGNIWYETSEHLLIEFCAYHCFTNFYLYYFLAICIYLPESHFIWKTNLIVLDLQIILTHEHADAVLGLDDIRAVQPFSPTNDIDPTPIYLSQHSMDG